MAKKDHLSNTQLLFMFLLSIGWTFLAAYAAQKNNSFGGDVFLFMVTLIINFYTEVIVTVIKIVFNFINKIGRKNV